MSKHSEGEWEAIGDCMVRIPGGKLALDCRECGANPKTDMANAKLIAASPLLLNALQFLVEDAATYGVPPDLIEIGLAAIKAATDD